MSLTIRKHLLASLFLLILLAISPLSAFGASWLDRADEGGLNKVGSIAYEQTSAPEPLQKVVARIIQVFLSLLGIIFIAIILVAGFRWMTAGGNDETVKKSVAQIRNAIIGLVIVVASYAITYFITREVFRAVN